ncbi:MAG: hypothetical protein Q9227_004606 [Pyrenula ochraceoflavens]
MIFPSLLIVSLFCFVSGSPIYEGISPHSDDAGTLERRDASPFGPTNKLPSTKITFTVGRVTYQSEFDTAHVCGNDIFPGVSRNGYIIQKQDMKVADYIAAAKKNPDFEMQMLVKDLQEENDLLQPVIDILGNCPNDMPKTSKRALTSLQTRADYTWKHVDAVGIWRRTTYWKAMAAGVTGLTYMMIGGALMAYVPANTAVLILLASIVGGIGLGINQVNVALIDYYKGQNTLPPLKIALFRISIGAIRSLMAYWGKQMKLKPPPNCIDWDYFANWLPGLMATIEAPAQGSTFEIYERPDKTWAGAAGTRKRSVDTENTDWRRMEDLLKLLDPRQSDNDVKSAVFGDEKAWEDALNAPKAKCDDGYKTLKEMLDDEGFKDDVTSPPLVHRTSGRLPQLQGTFIDDQQLAVPLKTEEQRDYSSQDATALQYEPFRGIYSAFRLPSTTPLCFIAGVVPPIPD